MSEKQYFLLLFGRVSLGSNGVEIDTGEVGFLLVVLLFVAFGIWVSCN